MSETSDLAVSPAARAAAPGRPRQRDATATRERLLDAAEAQFAARGLAGSRVDGIARAAGVNVQLIYRYFGDKDGLYRAAFDRVLGRLAAYLAVAPIVFPADVDPRLGFARQVGRYIDFVWDDPAYARMGLWSLAEATDPHGAETGSGHAALLVESEASVAAGVAAGVLRPDTTCDMFVATLIALSMGYYGLIHGGDPGFPVVDATAGPPRAHLAALVVGALLGAFGSG